MRTPLEVAARLRRIVNGHPGIPSRWPLTRRQQRELLGLADELEFSAVAPALTTGDTP